MPAHKRTKAQRLGDLERLQEMHSQGMSLRAMGEALGVGHTQICKDMKVLDERWRMERGGKDAWARDKEREINKINRIEREGQLEWERSKEDGADPRFLKTALDAIAQRIDLLRPAEDRSGATVNVTTVLNTYDL